MELMGYGEMFMLERMINTWIHVCCYLFLLILCFSSDSCHIFTPPLMQTSNPVPTNRIKISFLAVEGVFSNVGLLFSADLNSFTVQNQILFLLKDTHWIPWHPQQQLDLFTLQMLMELTLSHLDGMLITSTMITKFLLSRQLEK